MSVSNASIQAPDGDARRETRKRERHAERRRSILGSARSLLVQKGIENFTIAQVAEGANVSKPAVYYYFNSKEDLVLALSLDVLDAERLVLEPAVDAAPSAADALVALVRSRVDFYLRDRDSFRILHVWGPMLGLQGRVDESAQQRALLGLVSRVASRLGSERGRTKRGLRVEPSKLAEITWAMSQGILAMSVLGASGEDTLSRAIELRDGACHWLLDSIVG